MSSSKRPCNDFTIEQKVTFSSATWSIKSLYRENFAVAFATPASKDRSKREKELVAKTKKLESRLAKKSM